MRLDWRCLLDVHTSRTKNALVIDRSLRSPADLKLLENRAYNLRLYLFDLAVFKLFLLKQPFSILPLVHVLAIFNDSWVGHEHQLLIRVRLKLVGLPDLLQN